MIHIKIYHAWHLPCEPQLFEMKRNAAGGWHHISQGVPGSQGCPCGMMTRSCCLFVSSLVLSDFGLLAPGLSLLVQEEDGNWDQMEGIFTGLSLSEFAGRMLAGSLTKRHPHDGRRFFFVAAMKSDQRTCLVILCILFSRFFLPFEKCWLSLGMVP